MNRLDNQPDSSCSEAILTVNSQGIIGTASPSAETLIGMPGSAIIGRRLLDLFTCAGSGPDLAKAWPEVCQGDTKITCHLTLTDSSKVDGDEFFVTLLPLPETQNEPGVLIHLQSAPFSRPTDSMVLASIADGIFTTDRNWKITSFNSAAERITGWRADEVIGNSCSEVFQSSACGTKCPIAESLYSGLPVPNRSITIKGKDGGAIPVSTCAAPLADPDGNIIGGVESFRDLSALPSMRDKWRGISHFGEMVSKSRTMQRLFSVMPEIAASPSTVMLYGESGTGKELFARAIYNISDRKDRPFIAVNCGALPETLLESELFGYKAGAFTDARTDKQGRFAAADGGTLFLDEIGDIPVTVQVKLLRVLQERLYEPLGSNTSVQADVRIITATNRDLKAMVIEGTFREDLYYRLNVVRVHLPPLRERKEDIPLLVKQFTEELSAQQGKDIVGMAGPALTRLMQYNFPGNIRELKNIVEYAFILCEGGYILPEHLPDSLGHAPLSAEESHDGEENSSPLQSQTLEQIEKQAIFLALENNNWKKQATCAELGISRDTLRRKMAKYRLLKPGTT